MNRYWVMPTIGKMAICHGKTQCKNPWKDIKEIKVISLGKISTCISTSEILFSCPTGATPSSSEWAWGTSGSARQTCGSVLEPSNGPGVLEITKVTQWVLGVKLRAMNMLNMGPTIHATSSVT